MPDTSSRLVVYESVSHRKSTNTILRSDCRRLYKLFVSFSHLVEKKTIVKVCTREEDTALNNNNTTSVVVTS